MKIIADRPKLKSYATFSNVLSVGGFLTLLGAIILQNFKPEFFQPSIGLFGGGLILSIIGIFLLNRWGRQPRPETSLDEALKKFPDSHRLYHYSGLACKHILLTPNGLVLFHVINWDGKFSYKNGRWKERMNLGRIIRYPLEQHFGDPNQKARVVEQAVKDYFKDILGGPETVRVQSMIVFSHPRAKLELENPVIPVSAIDGLKKKVPIKSERMPDEVYQKIQSDLDKRYPNLMEEK